MISQYKPTLEKAVQPYLEPFRLVDPNWITILTIVPALMISYGVAIQNILIVVLGFPLLLLDTLDGVIARKFKKVTSFGAVLDSTVDRVCDAVVISSLGFSGMVSWSLVIATLVACFAVSYVRSRGELADSKRQLQLNMGVLQRTERLTLIFIAILFAWFLDQRFAELTYWLVFVLSVFTVLQRLHYTKKKLK